MRKALPTTLLLAATLVAAAPATAAERPSPRQSRAIAHAVHTTPVAGIRSLPRGHYRVTHRRISTVGPSWATAAVTPRKRYRDSLQGGYLFLVQPAGTRRWVVVDAGTSEVGCAILPHDVIADLLGGASGCAS